MAAIGAAVTTLKDWAKRLDPSGKIDKIAELLAQNHPVLTDGAWVQGNLPTGHRTTVRTGLPTVYWRMLNRGVPTSKSTTAQVDETVGMLEARSEVDVDLASLNADVNAFRLSEAAPFVEATSQEFESTFFYGAASSSDEFVGISARYADSTAANGRNILDGGGAGSDNCSIWFIGWNENATHLLFPKGSTAGIIHENLGVGDAFDSDNNRYRAYMDRWQLKGGLCVRDWRYNVRIANIDVSELVADSANAAPLLTLMTKAYHRMQALPSPTGVRTAIYMTRTCAEMLDIQRQTRVKDGGGVTWANVDGMHMLTFRGIPINPTDALLETESAVSFS